MTLYLSSKKFGNNDAFLKDWIAKHNNKVLLIINALDYKDHDKINMIVKEDVSIPLISTLCLAIKKLLSYLLSTKGAYFIHYGKVSF